MLLALCLSASAASLDNLEIAGPWGTPTTAGPGAVWWNPGALAAGRGTRLLIEAAPTFGHLELDRQDPSGGSARYSSGGVVPFAGLSSDLGQERLGVGVAFAVPYALAGSVEGGSDPFAGYLLREGSIQTAAVLAGAAWEVAPDLAVGLSGAWYTSRWSSAIDVDILPDLDREFSKGFGGGTSYTDADLEDPDYLMRFSMPDHRDQALSGGAGVRWAPRPDLAVGLSYQHGLSLAHTGKGTMDFGCPDEEEDPDGHAGAVTYGVCDTTLRTDTTVSYRLPWRINAGVAWETAGDWRLEGMGGLVGWQVHDDLDVEIAGIQENNPDADEKTAALLESVRPWARDNRPAFWLAADAKRTLAGRLVLGGRALYDHGAVPEEALTPSNWDAPALRLSALAAGLFPAGGADLRMGVSYGYSLYLPRAGADSGFSQSIDAPFIESRWFYPHSDGAYAGAIHRAGVSLAVAFGDRE